MDALVRYDANTFHLLDFDKSMHPIGAQLVGSKPELAGKAAKIIEDLGFDSVDFNCGCPVDKVTKDGSGSGMMKQPQKIGEILTEMVAAVKIPVTVKIRAGWDEQSINAPQIVKIAEQAGAKAITIHARTRKQGYEGPANWDWIRDAKKEAKSILVIGNGDVVCGESAKKMFEYTGCDGVLVARGTMGKPWVIQEILDVLEGRVPPEVGIEEAKKALLCHYESVLSYQHEKKAITDARRIGCWYLKSTAGTRQFRQSISRVESSLEALELIQNFKE